ncbi:MAG: glucose 1-dehydrogenase [Proteobacteria bacterium]|nr:glucose 1-dehydrogenase [Pseudomonadota bacterium]MDA1298596.1 glucose 1-dehydrogenase [Pseudomonadota bacterium]
MTSVNDLFDLSGKVALTTGSSIGMGRALAEGLAIAGAKVVISSRKLDVCEQTASEINELVGEERAIAVACNIGYKEQLQALVDETHDRLGPVDILMNNAGVNPFHGPSKDIPDSAWDKTMESNVRSNHWLCHMVLPDMVARKDGVIIITSSNGAFQPSTALGVYAISKAADLALVRNLAAEYGPYNIRVNALCPGLFKTKFAQVLWSDENGNEHPADNITLKRFGEPDELRGVGVFLASRAASYMTGQALIVDGGQVMVR